MMRPPPPASTLMENLFGTLDIMLGRPDGLRRIDCSDVGLWMSFFGLLLMLLMDSSSLSLVFEHRAFTTSVDGYSKVAFILLSLGVSLFAYGASMVSIYLLCQSGAERERFTVAVIVHNWAAPIISVAFLPILWLSLFLSDRTESGDPSTGMTLIFVSAIALVVIAGVRILGVALQLSTARAIIFFVVSSAVSLTISQGFESFLKL